MTHHLRYPVDAPFMDVAHQLLKALETLRAWGDEGDKAGITSLCLSLSGRPVDKPGWGHPVMMLLYAVLLIVGGFLLRGMV